MRVRVTLAATVVFALAVAGVALAIVMAVERDLVTDVRRSDQAALTELLADVESLPIDDTGLDRPTSEGPPVFTLGPDGELVARRPAEVAGEPFFVIGGAGAPALFGPSGPQRPGSRPLPPPGGRPPFRPPPDVSALEVYDPVTHEFASAADTDVFPDNYEVTAAAVSGVDGRPVVLAAATPLDDVDASVSAVTRTLWLVLPVLVVLVAALAWLLTGRALRPVGALTGRVREITGSTLHERVPEPTSADEIGALARTMNDMLDRLERSAVQQRRLVSDASHELRTPVAAIRTQLEVALRHPEGVDWSDVAHGVLAEDVRLEALVADLLTLARTDEQPGLREAGQVDLDDLVLAEAARSWRVPVDVSAVEPARVRGRATELRQLVDHLLANATRHAEGRVTVSLRTTEGRAVLWVDDDGPGVPVADRSRVFERFSRLSGGRERDAGGAGLGLAVVQRVAVRHGGGVEITDAATGGARFVVDLPVDPRP